VSSNLTIEPINRKKKSLSTELKFAARKRYGEPIRTELDKSDVPYFQGLVDAGIKDAQDVLDMIEKHDCIAFNEEW